MYRFGKPTTTTLRVNNAYQGESIEQKVERILSNNEPLTDGAPTVYQTREEGLKPQYDIRTDRWDLAIEASDHITKTELTKRQKRLEERTGKKVEPKKPDETGSAQGTTE